MSDIIIASIISGVLGVIAGVIGGTTFDRRRTIHIGKKKIGFPKARPCASVDYEDFANVILGFDDGLKFNFKPDASMVDIPSFVSMFYRFDEPVSLKDYKELTFELLFEEGNFNMIDLEMKTPELETILTESIDKQEGWKKIVVDISSLKNRAVQEICFVVKKYYKVGDEKTYGTFKIRKIDFDKKK